MTAVAAPSPHCRNCQSTEFLIEGDGPVICRPCVMMLGGVAADPGSATNRVLTVLSELHGDVVRLEHGRNGLAWEWIGKGWPDAEPRPLL